MAAPSILVLALLSAPDFPGKVVGVSDGDTLTVLRDGRTQIKVRLHGIDAPEAGQPFGARAKQAASDLCFGRAVTVTVRDTDLYGQTVAEVFIPDGRSLNRELVKQGWAWWHRQFAPFDWDLAKLEAEAKAAKRGLWSQPGAVAPWDWRRGEGSPDSPTVIGNARTHVYHRPGCRAVAKLSEKHKVTFKSAGHAEKAGYRPAGDCRPPLSSRHPWSNRPVAR